MGKLGRPIELGDVSYEHGFDVVFIEQIPCSLMSSSPLVSKIDSS